MSDDEKIEILDDGNNTSSPNFNLKNNNTDEKKLQNQIEQNKSRQMNTRVPSGNGAINNGNQFKNSGNLSKISGNKNNQVEENTQNNNLKNLGKEQIKPLVRKGVQAATGGAIGSDPVTGKIIDKAVDKVAENPNVDKIINDVTAKIEKKKKKTVIYFVVIFLSTISPFLIILLVISSLFMPALGSSVNNDSKQNKYEKSYYEEIDRVSNLYNSSCEGQFNETLISTTIFYDQIVYNNSDDVIYNDEEDSDIETSYNSKINYKGKKDDIVTLSKKLYPNFDFSDGADNSSSNACYSSYSGYKAYLSEYAKKNYKKLPDDVKYDDAINEVLAIGGYSTSDGSSACVASCEYNIDGSSVSNIMVRLLDNNGNPIEGEELISLEKYVLGVVYGEIGSSASEEQAKTQAIAARSFALSRPSVMNGAGGVKLVKEDGQWILSIRNSTNDRVYCDPDLGCSQREDAVFVSGMDNVSADPNATYIPKPSLDGNAPLRSYVSAVAGVVALDANGEILVTSYLDVQQNEWLEKSKEGKTYTEMLRETYQNMVELSSGNCSGLCSQASGDFTKWKQTDPQWKDVTIVGSDNIGRIGCTLTSVAIQVARSGVDTPLGSNFNPGTLVENYRDILFDSAGNFYWNSITNIANNFVHNTLYDGTGMASMSDSTQIAFLTNGINNGCYYVVEVKSWKSGQHWVAIDYIENDIIYMMDPASNNVDLNATVASSGYNYRINNAKCYQVR